MYFNKSFGIVYDHKQMLLISLTIANGSHGSVCFSLICKGLWDSGLQQKPYKLRHDNLPLYKFTAHTVGFGDSAISCVEVL